MTKYLDPTTAIWLEALKAVREVAGPTIVSQVIAAARHDNDQDFILGHTLWRLNKALRLPETRQKIADLIAEQINLVTQQVPAASPKAEELSSEGLLRIPSLLTSSQITEALEHFHLGRPSGAEDALLHYPIDSIVSAPHIMQALTNPNVLDIAGAYLGAWPTLVEASVWESLPGYAETGAQIYHRDSDDFRACKLFVYLTDVGPDDGPHIFVKRSHKNTPEEMFKTSGREFASEIDNMFGPMVTEITGAAGTSFLENTYCFHRGKVPTRNRRVILQGLYSLIPYPARIARMKEARVKFETTDARSKHAARLFL